MSGRIHLLRRSTNVREEFSLLSHVYTAVPSVHTERVTFLVTRYVGSEAY